MEVLILSRAEIERLLDPRELMGALGEAFKALSAGAVKAPARNELAGPDEAFLLGMPGRTRDGLMTVKVVTVYEGNAALGIPSHLATIGLYDGDTGACKAFLDGTYITAIRTSAAAALACDLLARRDARVLAIVGAGVQGEHHLRTFPLVRAFEEIRIASARHEDAERLAATDPRARATTAQEAARGADVVALATHAAQPVIEPGWIAPGTHVSSIGYRPPDGELPRELARAGRLFVETREAFQPPPVGCSELQGLDPATATELGEVLLERRAGRTGADELTVYKAMGHVAEDIAAAELVYAAALERGAGTTVEL
jgi:ornithine cyclodeaminase/alanine dehydrogenase-like protein (mu-crystallin family)